MILARHRNMTSGKTFEGVRHKIEKQYARRDINVLVLVRMCDILYIYIYYIIYIIYYACTMDGLGGLCYGLGLGLSLGLAIA